MGFLLAGLLQGAGAGLTQVAAQKREDALINLRRQYQQQDKAETYAREDASAERDAKLKVGLLTLAQEYKKQEGETEQSYKERLERIRHGYDLEKIDAEAGKDIKVAGAKAKLDKELEGFKASLDIRKDAASQRLKAEIENGQVEKISAAEDGTMVVTYKNGTTKVQRDIKLRDTGSGEADEEGGPIAAARALREGTLSPKPKGVASAAPADAARLRAEAQAAINNGAPRAAVEKRFKEMTGQLL